MFNLMKDHHKKLNSLINLKPRTRDNKNKRLEVIIYAGNIYNELCNIYRSKCNKKMDSLNAKNKKKLDYKHLKIIGDYLYSSDEEQEEQKEQKEQEEQEKQNKKPFDPEENIKWMINKEDTHVKKEIFKKYFQRESPSLMYEVLRKTNDKEKHSKLVNIFDSGLKDLKEKIKKMSKEEIGTENPDEIVRVVEMIFDFNK